VLGIRILKTRVTHDRKVHLILCDYCMHVRVQ
jgi:hypothetical protein